MNVPFSQYYGPPPSMNMILCARLDTFDGYLIMASFLNHVSVLWLITLFVQKFRSSRSAFLK